MLSLYERLRILNYQNTFDKIKMMEEFAVSWYAKFYKLKYI
jgi:hypothetical protein